MAAAIAGAVAIATGLVAALADLAPLALVTTAAAVVSAGLAVDLARADDEVDDEVPPDPDAALIDPESGLFIEAFFDASLRARVATARRVLRPLSIGLIEVVSVRPSGDAGPPVPLAELRDPVSATLREADMVFAAKGRQLAVLLEDTPEDGATWTLERLRRAIGTEEHGRRLWAGLASYPSHGLTADELIACASDALDRAKEWPQDRIEVGAS